MLPTTSSPAAAQPLFQEATPGDWRHLDIPHRMARAIERYRFRLDGTVTERDFQAEPETCELSLDELRANIGKATILVEEGEPAPAYDRAARIAFGVQIVLGLMPQIGQMHVALRAHFDPKEEGELWDDIVSGGAQRFKAERAPHTVTDLSSWARDQLARNAE